MSEVTVKGAHTTAAETASTTKKAPGLTFRRFFTKPGVSPYDEIEWERRTAQITDAQGNTIFEQKDVEVPKDWSMTATNIVASKYLHGTIGTPERESGVRATGNSRRRDHPRLGLGPRLFQNAGRRRDVPRRTQSHSHSPIRRIQFACLVQRRMRPHRARLRRPQLALESG